jgi:hypothetical protein
MNREWHEQNKMPAKATTKERIEWHLAHAKNCSCRPFPEALLGKLTEDERRRTVGKALRPEKR